MQRALNGPRVQLKAAARVDCVHYPRTEYPPILSDHNIRFIMTLLREKEKNIPGRTQTADTSFDGAHAVLNRPECSPHCFLQVLIRNTNCAHTLTTSHVIN